MFIHPRFLFLHIPKTGGQTVRWICHRAGLGPPASSEFGQHIALHELPPSLMQGRSIGACVREPCSWYRSYVHYNICTNGMPNRILEPFFNAGYTTTRELIYQLAAPTIDGIESLGIQKHPDVQQMTRRGIGLYTWTVLHMLGDPIRVDRLIDTGQLRQGLQQWMTELGIDIEEGLRQQEDLNDNGSKMANALAYTRSIEEDFDQEMINLIYSRDRMIVDLMGYTGPGSKAREALVEQPICDALPS